MKLKKILLSGLMVLGTLNAVAQPQAKTAEVFTPHWYVQVQPLGMQYTLGEVAFKDLIHYNVQLAGGYRFNPVFGVRLAVNGWKSKAGLDVSNNPNGYRTKWGWNYVAPTVDLTVDLTNWVLGYKHDRLFNLGFFAGLGANIAWDNKGANEAYNDWNGFSGRYQHLDYIWDGTKVRMVGQFGLTGDFRINDMLSVNLEVGANTLSDHYNSKRAGNWDWYFNALAGVKINIGETHHTVVLPAPAEPYHRVDTIYIKEPERIIERVVEPAQTAAVEQIEPLRRDIFFTIRVTDVVGAELKKVQEIADYMKKYPASNVVITGHADKGTGNVTINNRLSQKRADVVKRLLINKYGIDASRISATGKGHFEQPYAENDKNRVSICIAQ